MPHYRLEKMYHMLCPAIYWLGMYRDIQQFLAMCEPCARSSQRLHPPVQLQHPEARDISHRSLDNANYSSPFDTTIRQLHFDHGRQSDMFHSIMSCS